jgi:hypothetical protein
MGKLTEMTLAEVIPSVRRLSIVEKLQLMQILAADLDISPLEPFKIYNIQDRYNDFGIDNMMAVLFPSASIMYCSFTGVLILTITIESIGLYCI